ncbi:MAG: AMIN domain-containing protein [Candidatus Binatia bacterium]|nr:AMIN domain-containing protein [Candidatus Binatia bacterium]
MKRSAILVLASILALGAFGCSRLMRPEQSNVGAVAASPLLLRQVQVVSGAEQGGKAVILRLSRAPDVVRHEGKARPARVVIEASAVNAGEDLPERTIPQADPDLKGVRVLRKGGVLRVTLELSRDEPPPYSVREMADWILIQLGTPRSSS